MLLTSGLRLTALACLIGLLPASCAQPNIPKSPLAFPSDRGAVQGSLLMRPDGNGPFPGVVLMHTCGGVGDHMWDWGRRLSEAGYVALVVDSNTPRNVSNNCQGAASLISVDAVAGDGAAALAHLRTLPFVDGDRLGIMGFSFGAMASARLAGQAYQKRIEGGVPGLRAVVFFYGACGTDSPLPHVQASTNNLPDDVVTPTLLFLGALDTETPPQFCARKADWLRARGQPISYKLYPETTHSFDSQRWGTQGRQIFHGARGPFLYRYNPEATEDAWRETQAFFDRYLRGGS
jgi:dienelactone hydrolase